MLYFVLLLDGLLLAAVQGGLQAEAGEAAPLVGISRAGESGVKLTWTAEDERVYSIQYSDDLSTWWAIAMGNMDNWTDQVEDLTKGYYRISSNAPPELISIGDQTVRPGRMLQVTVSASDPDGDDLFFGVSNMPEGATFDPETGVFTWTPEGDEDGTSVTVRFSVTDGGTPELSDYEDITILVGDVEPEIIVTWPTGGQRFEANAVEAIEWVSKGDVGDVVHIDFSPDGGETWYVVKEDVPNVGYYNWIVPDSFEVEELPSDDCWIAVWSEDETIYGLNDEAFSIYETVFVIWSIYLIAGDGEYLGDCTTNPYVWDSIWNELGPYGSTTSWTSIWDPLSIYGSDYSDLSPWDPYALDPPYIFINDEYVASLTTNPFIWDAVYPEDFFDWVESVGY